ncbi:MAG: hypothetical protein QXQ14_01330 [Candidatus Aenigmatarchaeota archaeon]
MATKISILYFRTARTAEEIEKELNKVSAEDYWIIAKRNNNQIKIIFNFSVELEKLLRRVLEINEIENFFDGKSKQKVKRNIKAIMDFSKNLLIIFRGQDVFTKLFLDVLEKELRIKFLPYYISSKSLYEIIEKYCISLNQIYFKFVNGFVFEMYKGKFLNYSLTIREKMEKFKNNIRIITIIPKIIFERKKFSVTINGDKGSLKFFGKPSFKEINQIIEMIFSINRNGIS